MGFLSKLMKNPFVQMALPFALSYFMPGIGSLVGTSAISNPMMRSAAEQAMLGYGTAKLTGSKHPEKAAMYAGLGSMPFSFMKAQGAANMYNKDLQSYNLADFQTEPIYSKAVDPWWDYTGAGPGGLEQQLGIGSPGASAIYNPGTPSKFTGNFQVPGGPTGANRIGVDKFLKQQELLRQKPLTAWDVVRGKDPRITDIDLPARKAGDVVKYSKSIFDEDPASKTYKQMLGYQDATRPWAEGDTILPKQAGLMPEVDFYSKVGKGQKNLLGQELTKGETYTDWTPTIASQTAGWYGGRPTDEEEWEDAKKRRRKELAFMYGIDESLMGGELENPYYTGGGFWKDGGIAALQMDNGGAVDGPGGPKDDVIDAKLSDGEFVMTAKAVENLGGGDRMAGAKKMYNMMNQLDPQSETVGESVIGV
jgi:hypothetical protein